MRVRVRDRANPNPTPHLLDEEAQRRHLALGGGEVDGRALVLVAQVRALPAREHLLRVRGRGRGRVRVRVRWPSTRRPAG